MADRDDRYKAMLFEGPEHIPARATFVPATWMKYRHRLDALVRRHPIVFGEDQPASRDYDAMAQGTYLQGTYVDEWGCTWENVRSGMEALPTGHPIPTRQGVHDLRPPTEDTGLPHGFMYMRLFYLRGFEELMIDFAEEPPELQMLIDVVLAHNVRQMELLLAGQAEPTIIHLGDDLGMQTSLPMSPEKWRKYLKPCYAKLFGMAREAGHWVYLHSDGHFLEVIDDLVECGVNVINPQFRANDLQSLARICRGRLCVDLDIDRQMLPFCTPADIDAHIRDSVDALATPAGGLWLQCPCGPDVSLENIEAVCIALETHRDRHR